MRHIFLGLFLTFYSEKMIRFSLKPHTPSSFTSQWDSFISHELHSSLPTFISFTAKICHATHTIVNLPNNLPIPMVICRISPSMIFPHNTAMWSRLYRRMLPLSLQSFQVKVQETSPSYGPINLASYLDFLESIVREKYLNSPFDLIFKVSPKD